MQPQYDANTLHALPKDQLVVELLRARDEINELQAELSSRNAQLPPPAAKPRAGLTGGYTVSLNVLNITGNARQRICKSVPLQEILSRNFTRDDEREADTPLMNGQSRRMSELGRFSGFSVGTDGEGGLQLPEGLSPLRSSGRLSTTLSPEVGGATSPGVSGVGAGPSAGADAAASGTKATRNRPAPLLHVAGPLDSNAILSTHTLRAFARMGAEAGPMSPAAGPSKATNVMHYIMDVFARLNRFSHHQQQHSAPGGPMSGDNHIEGFGRTLLGLCSEAERVLREEPPHPTVAAPAYVFGDIHGNFRDLHYFATQIINFDDLRFSPYRFVFLGDYVDRGDHSVECVAFLFALKVLAPHKVTLLRGNHEDTLVNGDMNLYRDTSFRAQCRTLFGTLLGEQVWDQCNNVFSFLPLTANIDGKIFCTHGGLPQFTGGSDNRMDLLNHRGPRLRSFFEIPAQESAETKTFRKAATDVCWSDPAEDDRGLDQFGFGANPRGNGVILFGTKAVDDFLEANEFEYIFRAHQEKSDGLKISKNARVITIFSTSAYVGHQNGAGVVYVGDNRIRLIVKERDEDMDESEHYYD